MAVSQDCRVKIIACERHGSTSLYALKVSGVRKSDIEVKRRYSDFAALREGLETFAPSLPPMPPKSFFRKHASLTFNIERVRQLEELANAAVVADPLASMPAMRTFLGLSDVQTAEVVSKPRRSSSKPRRNTSQSSSLPSVAESECDGDEEKAEVGNNLSDYTASERSLTPRRGTEGKIRYN